MSVPSLHIESTDSDTKYFPVVMILTLKLRLCFFKGGNTWMDVKATSSAA